MADIVDPTTRSRMMSGVRARNTKPELSIRRGLHARGLRFRVNVRNMPGSPDILLPRFRTAIFVNGCFWHGHGCNLFKVPSTRSEFWMKKINGNRLRDKAVKKQLRLAGWRQLVVWECALKGPGRLDFDTLIDAIVAWLGDGPAAGEMRGRL